MMGYDAARDAIAEHLARDAAAHDAERYDEIGRRFDYVEHGFPRGDDVRLTNLRIALTFWDGWIDARNHGWPASTGIQQIEWPALARAVAADVAADREISDGRVRERFDATTHTKLGDRVQNLALRFRSRSAAG